MDGFASEMMVFDAEKAHVFCHDKRDAYGKKKLATAVVPSKFYPIACPNCEALR
ncbi:MAG: hypothetical protein WC966_10925 [Bradymonadales bacterium]|jgi:hypothetical protein